MSRREIPIEYTYGIIKACCNDNEKQNMMVRMLRMYSCNIFTKILPQCKMYLGLAVIRYRVHRGLARLRVWKLKGYIESAIKGLYLMCRESEAAEHVILYSAETLHWRLY
jgi:hypothetical protein